MAARSASADTRSNPTALTAADARTRVNADPATLQLRAQIDGGVEEDEFAADGTVDEAKEFVATHPYEGDDPAAWTQDQREAFNVLAQDFGNRHAEHHEAWHREHGSGGTQGEGSGEEFLQFHRDVMREFEEETGLPVPSGWDPSTPVPIEFQDPEGQRTTNDGDVELPGWLTVDGTGTTNGNADFGETVTIDGVEYDSLDDFQNPDQLGRALGESGYHGSLHNRLGGTMGGFQSPRDPAFYGWHGHVDGIVDQWLATENGQAWAAANPTSPLLDQPQSEPEHHHMSEAVRRTFSMLNPF